METFGEQFPEVLTGNRLLVTLQRKKFKSFYVRRVLKFNPYMFRCLRVVEHARVDCIIKLIYRYKSSLAQIFMPYLGWSMSSLLQKSAKQSLFFFTVGWQIILC